MAAVRRECSDIEMVLEETPVGEHQSNGRIEATIRQIQGVFRSIKDGLESKIGERIGGDHWIVPWIVRHAAAMMNRLKITSDGKTAFEKIKGRKYKKEIIEFGELVNYLQPETEGKDKFNVRWNEGAYIGHLDESGEALIATPMASVRCGA